MAGSLDGKPFRQTADKYSPPPNSEPFRVNWASTKVWWKNVDEPIVKREGGQNMLTARGGCFAKTIV